MKQINLLPPEVASQRSRQRTIPALIFAVGVAVAAVLVPWWMLQGVEASLDDQLTKQQQVLGIAVDTAAVTDDSFEAKSLAEIGTKVQALNALAAREVSWMLALDSTGDLVPKDIVLSTYNITTNPTSVVYRMVGDAPSNVSFATFVESLRQNKQVTKVVVEGFVFSPTKGTVSFVVIVTSPIVSVQFSKLAK
jgi:Tfp pilus assembly protein PilN